MRFNSPNFTQIPNDFLETCLPELGEVELKVLLVIMRKTFGYHKKRDQISLSQLQKYTGSSATNILLAVKCLIEKGVITKYTEGPAGKQVTLYELVVHEDSNNSYPSQIISTPPNNLLAPPPDKLLGETPDNLSVTKEKLQKEKQHKEISKQLVVVVEEKRAFTKDDAFFASSKFRKDWTAEEIENAYETFLSSKSEIQDPTAYIEGIINKKRTLKQNKAQSCQTKQNQNQLKNSSETDKPKYSGNAIVEPHSPQSSLKNMLQQCGILC
jgi:phage replication O-like protein O